MPSPALRRWYRRVQPAAEALFGFPELWRHYDAVAADRPDAPTFAEALLQRLGVQWEISQEDISALREVSGPLLLLANHPFGGADSLALVGLLEAIRPDGWRILSNRIVCSVPELRDRLIQVDPLSSEGESAAINRRGLVHALRHLRSDGGLGLFPAGRVSHRDPKSKSIADRPWSDHPARLATAAGASIAVLHIPGQNSSSFLRLPPRWSRLRALMLCRELTRPAETTVRIRLAALLSPADAHRLAAKPGSGAKLRAWCYLRADADVLRPQPSPSVVAGPLAPPAETSALLRAAGELRSCRLVISSGKFDIFLARGDESPVLLQELGRLREITFRAAGQGTGQTLDLAPEDHYYHHLLMWDREEERLAGAYRIGIVQDILSSHGPSGLYLDHVFKIRPMFYQKLGPAFELSRSFVLPDYQRNNLALAALWKGLGHAAVKQGIDTLFGSVTISNNHHPASRALLVEHLRRNYADRPDLRQLVQARDPFAAASRYHSQIADAYQGDPIDALAGKIDCLEEGQRGIPPLMRYYCGVGAKFLAFHVEASFADALYCLLRVDLHALPAAYRRRFLGV